MADNHKLIRDSSAYEGPSENAKKVADVPAGTVVSTLPPDVWSDKAFFKARLGQRHVYFLAANAVDSDEQVSTYEPPEPSESPGVGLDVWKRYAEEVGGEYSMTPAIKGNLFKGNLLRNLLLGSTSADATRTVNTPVGDWVITLETYVVRNENSSHTWTRMSAPYTPRQPLKFHVYRKTYVSNVGKRLFKRQDIEIGEADFDRDFVLQGSDEAGVRRLLRSSSLRVLLQDRNDLYLRTKGTALSFTVRGIIADIRLIRAQHSLFEEALNELQRMGFIR